MAWQLKIPAAHATSAVLDTIKRTLGDHWVNHKDTAFEKRRDEETDEDFMFITFPDNSNDMLKRAASVALRNANRGRSGPAMIKSIDWPLTNLDPPEGKKPQPDAVIFLPDSRNQS